MFALGWDLTHLTGRCRGQRHRGRIQLRCGCGRCEVSKHIMGYHIVVGPLHIIPTFFENGNMFFEQNKNSTNGIQLGDLYQKSWSYSVFYLNCVYIEEFVNMVLYCTQVGLGIELSHEDYGHKHPQRTREKCKKEPWSTVRDQSCIKQHEVVCVVVVVVVVVAAVSYVLYPICLSNLKLQNNLLLLDTSILHQCSRDTAQGQGSID